MNKYIRISALFLVVVLCGGCLNQRDLEAAGTAASRVHSQMRSGDYSGIYRESAAGFKTMSEPEFINFMTDLQKKLGALKSIQQKAYQTGVESSVGRTYSLIFDVEYELSRVRETLVMVRGDNGQMQLWRLGIVPMK